MTSMNRQRCLSLAAVLGAATGTAVAQDDQPDAPAAVEAYKAILHPVNNSGVSGEATLVQSMEGQWTVIVAARNLEPGQVHPQHIHGFENGEASTCPTIEADTDGDNLITLEEAQPVNGPALLPLEPFPMAEDGTVTYGQTLDAAGMGLEPLTDRIVELHGMTVPGQGYVETMPVACGEIVPVFPPRSDDEPVAPENGDPGPDATDTDDADTDAPDADPGAE